MVKSERKMLRRRLANAYLSSVVSISLVLLLIGFASVLSINAKSVSDYFRENLQLSVILKQNVSDADADKCRRSIEALPYVRQARLISREEGTEELKAMLGDDFLKVFETSPVPVSIELTLHAAYVSSDSLSVVSAVLEKMPAVDEVDCHRSLVDALNANLAKVTAILSVLVVLLLFVSYALIGNTVRINVFAQRFTIHTMKLVGATLGFIRRPFLLRALFQGLCSAVLALILLAGGLYFVRSSFAELLTSFTLSSSLVVAASVIVSGVVICELSTYIVVGRLVSLGKEDLYF